MNETWKPIAGFRGLYEVSDQGRVRSLDRTVSQPHPRNSMGRQVRRIVGRVLKANPGDQGYPRVVLCRDGRKVFRKVHQLVAAAFLGPRPKGKIVRHRNGRRAECAASNLLYGTHRQNAADSRAHGLMLLGSKRSEAKLDELGAGVIRALRTRVSTSKLAARFEVSNSAVSAIHLRRTWLHAPRIPVAEARRIFEGAR